MVDAVGIMNNYRRTLNSLPISHMPVLVVFFGLILYTIWMSVRIPNQVAESNIMW